MAEPQIPESFGRQAGLNIVLPGESKDEAVRRFVLHVCSQSLRQTANYRNWLKEATKRYESLRSTRSLDRDDPGTPWPRSSNIGLPLEAIMGEALIPRFNASITDSKPMFQARIQSEQQQAKALSDDVTDWNEDWLKKRVRIRAIRDETHRNVIIDGDAFEEPQWVDQWVQQAKSFSAFQDGLGNFLTDEAGEVRLAPANVHPDAIPDDPLTGQKAKKVLIQGKDAVRVYAGPKIIPWRVDETIWPHDATGPDVNDLDWFAVQVWKSPSWFKTREGDPIQGGLKNVDNLLLRLKHGIPAHLDTPAEQGLTGGLAFPREKNKILLWRFFGLFDVDGDGIDEEIMALVAPRERVMLGWRLASFRRRPFFHYQIFRLPGRFTARGTPAIAKGIRDMLDFHLNMANNRANIYLNPPVMYEIDSGFDPDIHMFGVGQRWGPLAPGGTQKIRPFDMPKSQEQLTLEFILFYISLMQRLTGVSDFTLGGPSRGAQSNIKTATGQALVTQEGNVKFADTINAFQEVSEQEMEFIDQEFFQSGLVDAEVAKLMSAHEIDVRLLRMPKTYHATGNSTTMNKQALQEISMLVFDRFANDPMFNVDPSIARQLRQRILDVFDVNDIELPPPEQIQQMQQKLMQDAIANMPPEQQQQIIQNLVEGGRNGNAQNPVSGGSQAPGGGGSGQNPRGGGLGQGQGNVPGI